MNRRYQLFVALLALAAAAPQVLMSTSAQKTEPGTARVALYRVAPGKHTAFLKWMAAREAVDKEVGISATQWYAHTDGDSWDYLAIGPVTTSDQEKKLDAAAKQKGLSIGFPALIEFRQYIASHTDTMAMGPLTASQMVAMAEGAK